MKFTTDQFEDAAGRYGDIAQQEGVLFERKNDKMTPPTYREIKHKLKIETDGPVIMLSSARADELATLPQTRVIVGVNKDGKKAFVPGIVLPDSKPNNVRIGALTAAEDMRPADQQSITRPFTDFQQVLLAKIAAQHMPETGSHSGSKVNGGEIGHAVVAAALTDARDIHQQVHQLVEGTQLSADIAASGITDFGVNGNVRQNREYVLTSDSIAVFVVRTKHVYAIRHFLHVIMHTSCGAKNHRHFG